MPSAAEKSVIARLKKLGCEVLAGRDCWDVRLRNVPLDAAIDDICQLKSVTLELSRLKESHHAMLSRLVNVTDIGSDHCSLCDGSFSYLANLPRLVSLTIFVSAPADITGVGIGQLAKTSLESLTIHGSALSDQGAEEIAEISTLQSIEIIRGAMTDVALKSLRRLQLESLSLSDLKVSDVGLREIAAMTSLKYLFLSDLPITDVGLSRLEKLRSLTVLDISCSAVSEEAVQALIAKLPNVES